MTISISQRALEVFRDPGWPLFRHARLLVECVQQRTGEVHGLRCPALPANPPSSSSINEFKLRRGFKPLYDNTVLGCLRECRMTCAKEMLRQGDLNILKISLAADFANPGHFPRLFKKRFGLQPKACHSLHAGRRTHQMRKKPV